jgi:hypothetical protein
MFARVRHRVVFPQHPGFSACPAGRPLRQTHQNEMINAEARGTVIPRAPNVRSRLAVRAGPMVHPWSTSSKGKPSVPILRQETFTGKDGSPTVHSSQAESEVSDD